MQPSRLTMHAGRAAVATAVLAIGGAIIASDHFSWTHSALSDLGVEPGLPALLFNGGLIVAGIIGLPFAWWYWTQTGGTVGAAAAGSYVISLLGLLGVGLFPSETTLHLPSALLVYLGATYALAFDGTHRIRSTGGRSGVVWLWAALGHLTCWLLWALATVLGVQLGLAVPEAIGAAVFGVWVVTRPRSA